MDASRRISKARTHLLLDHPWFGSLSLRLKLEKGGTETMSVDGVRLYYNEDWVNEQSDQQLVGLVAHEVSHVALLHVFRGNGKDWQEWNEACDLVINPMLRKEGLQLPKHPLENEESLYPNMTAEQIYAARKNNREQSKSGPTPGSNNSQNGKDQQPWPDFRPAPQGGETESSGNTETDWKIATEQATAVAKKAGKLPGGMDRAVKSSHQSQTDWRTILRRFIENTVPVDYSWMHPNRRYIAQGIYLPGILKENMPKIGVAVDTSGSITKQLLANFAKELTAILHEARPESIEVVYCDTKIQSIEEFTPDDPEITLKAKGGGGTSFQPPIDHFSKNPPVCMIYLTDLEASRPSEPNFPVLWAIPEWQTNEAWFGETIRITDD